MMNNSRWNGFSSLSSILPGSIFGAKKEKEPITASMDVVSATDRADAKRRRSPQMDIDDESPNAKRAKRSSPPLAARIRTEPPRRARSVKALNYGDVHGSGRNGEPKSLARPSRGLSTGLSGYMDKLHVQSPGAPTPASALGPTGAWSSLGGKRAGVAQMTYNVNRSFAPRDPTPFSSTLSPSLHQPADTDRLSVVPETTSPPLANGATFGPLRPTLAKNVSSAVARVSKSPPSLKPALERHADRASWAGSHSGSVRSTRLGDNSLRVRTQSLVSRTSNNSHAISNPPYSARAPSVGRTTPTPKDGHTSPPVTSPEASDLGSPGHSSLVPLPHVQRAAEMRGGFSTTLRHGRDFNRVVSSHRLRVPSYSASSRGPEDPAFSPNASGGSGLPSAAHSRGQSAASGASAASGTSRKTDASEKAPSKTALAAASPPLGQGNLRKIGEKRKAEVLEVDEVEMNAQFDEVGELSVEPIRKGRDNLAATIGTDIEKTSTLRARTTTTDAKPQGYAPPLSVSESASATSSRTVVKGQERINGPPPEKRTRIPEEVAMKRYKPSMNERLRRAETKTGRFSVPPDDEEEVEKAKDDKEMRVKTSPLTIPDEPKVDVFASRARGSEESKGPSSSNADSMSISPVKESDNEMQESPADLMSTTPTESSIKATFTVTPIVKPAETAPAPAAPTTNGNTFPFSAQKEQSRPEASPSTSTLAGPIPKAEAAPSPFLGFGQQGFGGPSAKVEGQGTSTTSQASNISQPAPKPTSPTPQIFSWDKPPDSAKAETSASGISTSSSLFGAPTEKPKSPPPAVVVTEPPKPLSSFFTSPSSAPAPSNNTPSTVPKSATFSFTAPPATEEKRSTVFDWGKPASKPDESDGKPKPPAFPFTIPASATEEKKPATFDWGKSVPKPAEPARESKPTATFSFGPLNSVPAVSSTAPTSTELSPEKPTFSFGGSTTPSTLPPGNTALSTPFSFGATPSPVKETPTRDESPTKTPTKPTFSFGTSSTTTPSTNPPPFTSGSAPSTTPADSHPPTFIFGAQTSTVTPQKSQPTFSFEATPKAQTPTTPAGGSSSGFSFTFGAGTDSKNSSTPSPAKPFTFGAGGATSSFSFGNGEATTPTTKHAPSFSFGQTPTSTTPAPTPTTATSSGPTFSLSAPSNPTPSSNGTSLVFPAGPTTPLTKTLELDGMDTSPIRGGNTSAPAPSFSSTSNVGFSFGAPSNSGGFGSAPTSATTPFGGGFGTQSGSGFGAAGATPTPSPFNTTGPSAANGGSSAFGPSGGFGGTSSSGFGPGTNTGFAFGASSTAPASPFGAQSSLPTSNTFGGGASAKASADYNSDAGSASGGPEGRKMLPLPKPRKNRTAAEQRAALQRFHRG